MEAMLVMISALNTFNTMPFHGSDEKKSTFVNIDIFTFVLLDNVWIATLSKEVGKL